MAYGNHASERAVMMGYGFPNATYPVGMWTTNQSRNLVEANHW